MKNPNIDITAICFLTPAKFEAIWNDVCPGCNKQVSAIRHDYSLCSQLQNALYRIRQLENNVEHKPSLRPPAPIATSTPERIREPHTTVGYIPTPNLAPENWIDISKEKQRTYIFANQEQIVINRPLKLHITRRDSGDSHRIIDAQGQAWYIRAGWFAIMFETENGKVQF